MTVYHLLIILAVLMFGGDFALNDLYRRLRGGGGLKVSLQSTFIGSIAGLIVLWLINGFRIEFTPFTLLIAFLASANSLCISYCTFKALGYINLSLYSVFMMLGGMLLPFLQGIIFYGEGLSLGKLVCCAFIFAALAFTIGGKGKRGGALYYIGVFLCNGLSGVLSNIFSHATVAKTGVAGYSILTALTSICLSLLLLLTLARKMPAKKLTVAPAAISATVGTVNRFANYLLVFALASGVEASVQYPMVTGGVMIVSTLIAALGKRKPQRNEIISVVLAFLGLLLLFLIPV